MLLELLLNALATGTLLGCLYAALALGLTITFGLLHIPNVAHPAFVVVGAFGAALANEAGWDPFVAAVPLGLLFYGLGLLFYEAYARIFEARGEADTMQALTLFFGISLIIETALVIRLGADQRSVDLDYVGRALDLGLVTLPYRLLLPALVAPVLIGVFWLYLTRSDAGIAIRAVAHDERALSISGIDPRRVRRHAFGLAATAAAIAGAALVVVGPVDPFAGRAQIGRAFAVVVLAGMGSVPGTLVAGILIGVSEALVAAFGSPSWAPGVAFAILLATLTLKPSGLFGTAR